jgi:hypothetical protein
MHTLSITPHHTPFENKYNNNSRRERRKKIRTESSFFWMDSMMVWCGVGQQTKGDDNDDDDGGKNIHDGCSISNDDLQKHRKNYPLLKPSPLSQLFS